ncbi:MAG: ORF6N domain-containing protein [Deltaproteobacteria bacterium]|nr:ORF6N domain-containing protein [Deltaproteobacteria bacterium]
MAFPSGSSGTRVGVAIRNLRGEKIILDADLAALYGVPTKVLLQAVKRHQERFPSDFMFQMTREEFTILRSQSVTSSGRRYPPYAFTEQGVAMLSSVLNSPRAIRVNIEIMRAFVRMRRWLSSQAKLEKKLLELEEKYDGQFALVFEALKQLMAPPEPKRKRIGFQGNIPEEEPS